MPKRLRNRAELAECFVRLAYLRLLVPMALTLVGCEAHIGTIVAKPGYYSDPRRIYIVDAIDPIAGKTISLSFRNGM